MSKYNKWNMMSTKTRFAFIKKEYDRCPVQPVPIPGDEPYKHPMDIENYISVLQMAVSSIKNIKRNRVDNPYQQINCLLYPINKQELIDITNTYNDKIRTAEIYRNKLKRDNRVRMLEERKAEINAVFDKYNWSLMKMHTVKLLWYQYLPKRYFRIIVENGDSSEDYRIKQDLNDLLQEIEGLDFELLAPEKYKWYMENKMR